MKHNGITLHPHTKSFRKAAPIPADGRLKTIASGTAEVFKLDPRFIERETGFNPRYDFGDIQALAEDILENGILEALKVRKESTRVFLVNGDRRLTAVELLIKNNLWPQDPNNPGHPLPIPCTSEGKGIKPLDRIFMMLSLNTGKPFNMLEKGFAYQEILATEPELNASEIARRSGETKQAVSNALQIVTHGSPTLIEHIKKDSISATTALDIIKATNGHDEQNEAAQKAIDAAKSNGRNHATPKDLPSNPKSKINNQQSSIDPATPPANPSPASDDPTANAFIADPNDDDEDDVTGASGSGESSNDSPNQQSSSPPDPGAYQRLKGASSSNRDGSSGGPGEGFATPDKRVKNIEKALDELDKDKCNTDRWDTVELILDYLNGSHTIKTIKDHLAL